MIYLLIIALYYFSIPLQLVHKRLAVQLVGIMVDTEEKEFGRRLPLFLPLLLGCLKKRELDDQEDEEDTDSLMDVDHSSITLNDHLLFNTLLTVEKLFTSCGIDGPGSLRTLYDEIWGGCVTREIRLMLINSV